ncbi:hypothetical protein NDU88_009882 [Pleurodeles waltl]|uniref:Uncharacterized protein n=1 Tax=Pleurodeles waltl TaxID=8319 RepID=A0AAV7RXI7_PLEWA|nr:hypothetical protein NDU88_009882 [Pleurodeles waltl]
MSSGSPILNGEQVNNLLIAQQLTKQVAVKCRDDHVTLGNRYANKTAKHCAHNVCTFNGEFTNEGMDETNFNLLLTTADNWDEVKRLQEEVSEEEQQGWVRAGCVKRVNDIWVIMNGRPELPNSLPPVAQHFHGSAHIGRDAMDAYDCRCPRGVHKEDDEAGTTLENPDIRVPAGTKREDRLKGGVEEDAEKQGREENAESTGDREEEADSTGDTGTAWFPEELLSKEGRRKKEGRG